MSSTWNFESLGLSPKSQAAQKLLRPKPSPDTRSPAESVRRDSKIDSRYDIHPSVSSSDPTELFTLIREKRWDYAKNRCLAFPDEASVWIVEKNDDESVRWKLLPIHQACELMPPVDVLEYLIKAYPRCVCLKDSAGDLPIHLACRERASVGVVNTLLLAEPETAKEPDDEGRLPIHLACRQGAGLDIVGNLLVAYHRGAQVVDSYGLLPVHWACAQNAKADIIEALLKAYPDARDIKDKWGRTPLSLAYASTNPEKELIIEYLNRNPSYWVTSMEDEVTSLKSQLDVSVNNEKEVKKKATSLEAQLAEVTAASSSASQEFREMKQKMEGESEALQSAIDELTKNNEEKERKLADLSSENERLKGLANDLSGRLSALTILIRKMERQRMQILEVTGLWEDALQEATSLVLDDEEDTLQEAASLVLDEKSTSAGTNDEPPI